MLLLRLAFKAARFARKRIGGGRRRGRGSEPDLAEMQKHAEEVGRHAKGVEESFARLANAAGRLEQSASQVGKLGRSGVIQLRVRTNARQVADQIDALEAELEDAARRTMEKAVLMVQAEAQRRAPVDTGTLRRSIATQVRPLGAQKVGGLGATKAGGLGASRMPVKGSAVAALYTGVVGTNLRYARAVEFGRRPGKRPPTASLRGWARRKTGSADNAYRIAKRIGERGTSPQPYLEPALEAKRGEIQRMFERELGNVLKRFQ